MQSFGAHRELATVFLVDDDEDLRMILRDVLEGEGFEVVECEDLLDGLVPDVVLLDRDLPDGSGLDVARWMRRRTAYDGARIIGLSGRTDRADVAAAFAAGCDAVVGKPCTADALVEEICGSRARPCASGAARPRPRPLASTSIRG
jgi:DNA-binding response OmpR family regulator